MYDSYLFLILLVKIQTFEIFCSYCFRTTLSCDEGWLLALSSEISPGRAWGLWGCWKFNPGGQCAKKVPYYLSNLSPTPGISLASGIIYCYLKWDDWFWPQARSDTVKASQCSQPSVLTHTAVPMETVSSNFIHTF